MKTIVLFFALLIPSVLSAAPLSESSKTPLPAEATKIVELYSIYCGACFYWEQKMIPELKEKLKEKNIIFKQAHMPFMGKFSKEASTALAMTEGTPLYDKIKSDLFQQVRANGRNDWPSEAAFFKTLEQAGLSQKEYEQNKNGPVVLKTLADWGAYAKSTNSVPAFLLNGKYPIDTKGVKTVDDFLARVDAALKTHSK